MLGTDQKHWKRLEIFANAKGSCIEYSTIFHNKNRCIMYIRYKCGKIIFKLVRYLLKEEERQQVFFQFHTAGSMPGSRATQKITYLQYRYHSSFRYPTGKMEGTIPIQPVRPRYRTNWTTVANPTHVPYSNIQVKHPVSVRQPVSEDEYFG